jgi:hypothetical protein
MFLLDETRDRRVLDLQGNVIGYVKIRLLAAIEKQWLIWCNGEENELSRRRSGLGLKERRTIGRTEGATQCT